mgnify:FL=1
MQMMMSLENYKEMLGGSSLYKLELEKNRIQDRLNDKGIDESIKNIDKQYLKIVEELISKEINASSNREAFKLSQLKYTKHHWMSGEIVNGCPITTSIEIKPEMLSNKWKVDIVHKYMLEDNHEKKVINKQYDLPNEKAILGILEKEDLRDLKNNYFSDDKIQKYSHWELEYNYYFKISGTFDQEPKEVKKVVSVLNCENIINEALKKVDEIIKPMQDKQKSLYTIAESIYKEIEKLPINSEFKIAQFFKDYNIEENDKFDLCKQVISYCIVNNVKIIEKFPDADLGLPWNIPRIKK